MLCDVAWCDVSICYVMLHVARCTLYAYAWSKPGMSKRPHKFALCFICIYAERTAGEFPWGAKSFGIWHGVGSIRLSCFGGETVASLRLIAFAVLLMARPRQSRIARLQWSSHWARWSWSTSLDSKVRGKMTVARESMTISRGSCWLALLFCPALELWVTFCARKLYGSDLLKNPFSSCTVSWGAMVLLEAGAVQAIDSWCLGVAVTFAPAF